MKKNKKSDIDSTEIPASEKRCSDIFSTQIPAAQETCSDIMRNLVRWKNNPAAARCGSAKSLLAYSNKNQPKSLKLAI